MKRKILYQILTLLFFTICFNFKSAAQSIKAEAKLEQSTIRIGEQTYLHFTVNQPIKAKVSFPQIGDTLVAKIQIVNVGKTDTIIDKSNPESITLNKEYKITGFDEGTYTIPSFTFSSGNETAKTNELILQIATVKVDTTKGIYDIKQPIAVSYTFLDWLKDNWLWIVGFYLILFIIAGIMLYLHKKPTAKTIIKKIEAPALPPHIIAINNLKALREKKLWQQNDFKLFYSELTDILREYLEKRYQIKTHEKTTYEIIASLMPLDITDDNKAILKQILVLADLVKFAKEKPLPNENELSMENSMLFVIQTQQVETTGSLKGENENV
jgi:hypothetical protein